MGASSREKRRSTMTVILSRWVMLVMVLISMPGYPAERLAPYDDFNATPIDPDKWFGG
jgi:hypothetical protein